MEGKDHHSCKPSSSGHNAIGDVRNFFTLWIERLEHFYEERDRRYGERFESQEKIMTANLAAHREAVSKSEQAQKIYNEGHNDLSRKMEAQYKEMLPRQEATVEFKSLEDQISRLREFRSESGGRTQQARESRMRGEWIIGICLGTGISLAALILGVVELLIRNPK